VQQVEISPQNLSNKEDYQNSEKLKVLPLPDPTNDHDYCRVLPKPIKSPLRVRPGTFKTKILGKI
jgi:hypothetical protein